MSAKMKKRKAKTIFLLSLLSAVLAAWPVFGGDARGAFAGTQGETVEAVGKSDVGYEDDENIQAVAQKANVLFFLDTSHPMMIEPRGRVPYVVPERKGEINDEATRRKYGYGKADAIDMMRRVTFGVGTVPPVDSFFTAPLFKWVNYGRDTDERNNLGYGGSSTDINDPANYYRYYSPYALGGHNLRNTFKNQGDAYPGIDNNSGLGYYFKDTRAIVNGKPLPYMLVFKNPEYWEKGMPGFDPKNPKHREELVPNDSRMYQTKLVMWRLMEDKALFANIRFGLATIYSNALTAQAEYKLTNDTPWPGRERKMEVDHVVYKVDPWGADNTYRYGAYYMTERNDVFSNAQYGRGMQGGTWALYNSVGAEKNLQFRAFLRVPIADYGKVWVTKGKKVSMTHVERFMQWIDGVEDIAGQYNKGGTASGRDHDLNSNQFAIHRNPELKVSNPLPISRAIFPNPNGSSSDNTNDPNRQWYARNQGVAYAKRDSIFFGYAKRGDKYNFYFKPGSGEAVGSVIDFFSPDYGSFGSAGGVGGLGYTNDSGNGGDRRENFEDLIDEQFPIRSTCAPNYMILLTAGDSSLPEYPTEKAIEALYNYTKNNDVTIMYYLNGQRRYKKARLEHPIKTIVVGFLDPRDTSAQLLGTLNRMARAGDPENPDAKPYMASNLPALHQALREILEIINRDVQPDKSAMLEGDSLSTDDLSGVVQKDEKLNLYAASFRINLHDQWEGALTKYVTSKNLDTGAMVTKKDGELGARLVSARDGTPDAPRKLFFWSGEDDRGSLSGVGFTGEKGSARKNPHKLAKLIGLGDGITASMDLSTVPGGTLKDKTHISRAMLDWYYGYDVSYADGKYHKRESMLPDQGRSGIVMAKPPAEIPSLPGFTEFAASLKNIKPRIFTQTNDGVLHVVDPATMNETLGILPPPTLLPHRMFTLKASKFLGQYRWIDVGNYVSMSVGGESISSVPAYILDGPLQIRHFNLGSNDAGSRKWQTFLYGTLGRGGGGMYAMNVTDPEKPTFYWYRETIENGDGGVTLVWRGNSGPVPPKAAHKASPFIKKIERGEKYWADVFARPDKHAYEQLGFNSPKPNFGVVRARDKINGDDYKYRNLIALSGGMQNKFDPDGNGKMGAAMYLMDPDAVFHREQNPNNGVRVFNSGSLKKAPPEWREGTDASGSDPYMGMVISEPVFRTAADSKYISKGLFFSDNLGRIFYVNFIDPATGMPLNAKDWEIRTVASLRGYGDAKTDCYSIPSGVRASSLSKDPDRFWVAGGTSDVTRADPAQGDDSSQRMRNKAQMIFAFAMPDLADGRMTKRDNWTELKPDSGDSGISDKGEGWFMLLAKEHPFRKAEYVTARPELFGGSLYVPTFQQSAFNINSDKACEAAEINGDSRLYVLSLETGQSMLWGNGNKKYLKFDGIKLTGLTVSKKGGVQSLLVSYEVLDKDAAERSINQNTGAEENLTKVDGMDALAVKMLKGDDDIGKSNVKDNDGVVEYWRMWNPAGK